MPSLSRKLSQKRRSHVSKRKSSVHRRKLSAPRRKSVAVKRTRSTGGGGATAKFWCMKCKNFSKNDIDRYERGRTGGMFAKGRCKDCDTKVSVIVKADDVRH